MNNNALIIFVRNPVLGKVKKRLAATIGNEKALQVYQQLLQHTQSITANLSVKVFVYYADFLNGNDLWNGCEKKLQKGNDLGERMKNAFEELFTSSYKNVCIIGSDCYEITTKIIEEAFEKLQNNNAVIGGAIDGGYYLLGMNKLIENIFITIEWSTNTVFNKTVELIEYQNLSYQLLPFLNDVDEEKDITFTY